MSDNCPVCLGSGLQRVPDVSAHGKRNLIVKRYVVVTCFACHGSCIRPEWMKDKRGEGYRDSNFDYAAHQ